MMKLLTFIPLILALLAAGCSSRKKVQEEAKAYRPVIEQGAQIKRAVAMIEADAELSTDQKKALVKLIYVHAERSEEIKRKQSQIRAVLIEELLKSSHGQKSLSVTSAKELDKLNKEHIKNLDKFIRRFRIISGEAERNQDSYMKQIAGHAFL